MTWKAPCGHDGIPIIGTYVMCQMCDAPNRAQTKPVLTLRLNGKVWRMQRILPRQEIPDWATRQWQISSTGMRERGENLHMPDVELRTVLEKLFFVWGEPGTPLSWKKVYQGKDNFNLLVFGVLT